MAARFARFAAGETDADLGHHRLELCHSKVACSNSTSSAPAGVGVRRSRLQYFDRGEQGLDLALQGLDPLVGDAHPYFRSQPDLPVDPVDPPRGGGSVGADPDSTP